MTAAELAARADRLIAAAEDEREHPTYDPQLADRAQDHYERSLGWGCD